MITVDGVTKRYGDKVAVHDLSFTVKPGIASHTFGNSHHLSPWGGFALFCGYAAIAVIAAAISLRRRDA